jgi:chlorobactene glucosyltransferase
VTLPLLLALPWGLLLLHLIVSARLPRDLLDVAQARSLIPDPPPLVSVIIPARNEAHNIARVVGSVTASDYPIFEVVVVDDQSHDGTGDVARSLGAGRSQRLEVMTGRPLPEGWLGKPWSCSQGASVARGELLLFTDADTVHDPELLVRAVAGLIQDRADALTVLGRQLMETFWERVLQPSIFFLMLSRFRFARSPLAPARWRDAIANGQYLLFRREVYDALGGHEAVKGEVVEDLRLAQILVRGGRLLTLRRAEEALATRMYLGFAELVRGWSKNLALGAMHTVSPWLRPILVPGSLLVLIGFWIAPLVALLATLLAGGPPALLVWSSAVVLVSTLFWCAFTWRMGAPFAYGVFYPLGTLVTAWILLRSWLRGTRVEWKGREYRVRPLE